MESVLAELKKRLPCIPNETTEAARREGNRSWMVFRKFHDDCVNIISGSKDCCCEFISLVRKNNLIGSAEEEIAEGIIDPVIKTKMIMTAISTMIKRSKYHLQTLQKVICILQKCSKGIPPSLSEPIKEMEKVLSYSVTAL